MKKSTPKPAETQSTKTCNDRWQVAGSGIFHVCRTHIDGRCFCPCGANRASPTI